MIRIYFGKSASGKDTFLKKSVKCGMKPIVSYTTRPKRVGEVEGVDYHFVTAEEFSKLNLLEQRSYNVKVNGKDDTWYYGSPQVDPTKDHVAVVDIKGLKLYIDTYGAENIEPIYVYTDDKVREDRAKLRGSFDQTEWNRRAVDDDKVFSPDKLLELCEYYGKPIRYINNTRSELTTGFIGIFNWRKEIK